MNQWQSMIVDLKEKGLTQTQIASEIKCSQNYVSNLENGLCGKRIGYDLGKSLERLWKKHCSRSPAAQVGKWESMKEAIEKGYLGGKYTVPKTIKFTHEMLDAIAVASETNEQDTCSWMREVIAKALLAEDAKYERMARARNRSQCTSSTLVHL